MARLLVFGSINLDIGISVARLPAIGETLIGSAAALAPGGKGANQAHAAGLFGADVDMVGAVGDDAFSEVALRLLREAGVGLQGVRALPGQATGIATIAITVGGDNAIIVAPGANDLVRADWVSDALLASSRIVVLQMEVPVVESSTLARRARRAGCRVVLNAAPARSLDMLDLADVDWLVVNETELASLSEARGHPDEPRRERAARLSAVSGVAVVLTLGADGAWLARPTGGGTSCEALRVPVVDTTGAGDTLVGVFAAALAEGMTPERALRCGVVAAGLACRAHGAQRAQPARAEIDATLEASWPHASA